MPTEQKGLGCTQCGDLTEEQVLQKIDAIRTKLNRVEAMDDTEIPSEHIHADTIALLELSLARYYRMLDGE